MDTASSLFPDHEIVVDSRITEKSLGEWEGEKKTVLRKRFPEAFKNGRLDPNFVPVGGESLESFTARVLSFLRYLRDAHHATVVLVTHNGVIRIIRHIVDDLPLEKAFGQSEAHLVPIGISLSPERIREPSTSK